MSISRLPLMLAAIASTLGCCAAQNLPGTMSFSVTGSFSNGVAESKKSILIADNNLNDGYASGFDLKDVPTDLGSGGPSGSAAFQWGSPSSSSSYPHASALWFSPTSVSNAQPEQVFKIADLYYRNGTIVSNTGASSVGLNLSFSFSNPSGMSQMNTDLTMDLINTTNGSDPVASADIVQLGNPTSAIRLTDANGNTYYLNLSFRPDQDTMDGTLSSADQFRVFEGMQGRAELWGQFSTVPNSPSSPTPVPEPSSLLLGCLGSLLLFRRKR